MVCDSVGVCAIVCILLGIRILQKSFVRAVSQWVHTFIKKYIANINFSIKDYRVQSPLLNGPLKCNV